MAGRSSFFTPRSMRWPPVTLTIGTWYLSATSAMRRNSAALVTPPHIRGYHRAGAVLLDVGVRLIRRDCGSSWLLPARLRSGSSSGPGGRWQPFGVFQSMKRMAASRLVSRCSRMALRICPWLRSLQPQMAFSLFGLTSAAPPTVLIRICSTNPAQEPGAGGLGVFLTSSTLNRPCSCMALTMVPLQTPPCRACSRRCSGPGGRHRRGRSRRTSGGRGSARRCGSRGSAGSTSRRRRCRRRDRRRPVHRPDHQLL